MGPDTPIRRPNSTIEALERARFAIQTNRPLEAERIATEILSVNSGNREANKILGYAQIMFGRFEQAIVTLVRAAEGNRDSELEAQIGITYQRVGRTDDALTWLQRAAKRKPPHPAALFELGRMLAALHRLEEAIDVLKKGVEATPLMPEMRVQLGYAYDRLNDRKGAASCFRQVLTMDPRHPAAIAGLGTMLLLEHDFEGAAETFKRLVMADPSNAEARLRLGTCLLNLGETAAALACMRAAAAQGPQFYSKALRTLISSGRGRFWLRPSDAKRSLTGR